MGCTVTGHIRGLEVILLRDEKGAEIFLIFQETRKQRGNIKAAERKQKQNFLCGNKNRNGMDFSGKTTFCFHKYRTFRYFMTHVGQTTQ